MTLFLKKNKQYKLYLTSFVALFSVSGYANSDEDTQPEFTEAAFIADIPEVISATFLPQKLTEAPASITIIDQQMLNASSAVKVTDLFRLVPGMQVYDVHSNKHGVSYHGMENDFPNRLEIRINNRSVYIPLLSTVTWETLGLDIADIDHIEVVRGSNAPSQGSNSFLGAINIITKKPHYDHDSFVQTTQSGGGLNTQNYSGRQHFHSPFADLALSFGHHSNDGIDRFDDAGQNKYLRISSSITPNLTDSLTFDAGFSTGYAFRGKGEEEFAVDAGFVKRKHSSNYQLIKFNKLLQSFDEISLTYYHNYLDLESPRYTDDELQTLLEAAFGVIPLDTGAQTNLLNPQGIFKETEHGTTDVHDLELLHTKTINEASSLAIGLGYRYNTAKSDALFQNGANEIDENRFRTFGNWEYKYNTAWVFNTGGMLEYSDLSGSAFSPRFAVNYLIDETSAIRAAYTIAHRLPSLLEQGTHYKVIYPLGAGTDILRRENFDLKPEQNNSFDIGFVKAWPESQALLDVRVFYEDITDAIDSQWALDSEDTLIGGSGTSNSDQNAASWINQGIEIQAKFSVPIPLKNMLILNYGYNNPSGMRDRGTGRGLDSLDTRAPNHTASLLWALEPTHDTSIGLSHFYMDHTEWLEGYNFTDSINTQYQRTDINLKKRFKLNSSSELEAAVIIQNLLDKRYPEFYRYNDFDQRIFLRLRLNH